MTENTVHPRISSAIDSIKSERFDEAIIVLKTILKEAPKHELAQGMLASTYLQLGMHELAVIHYRDLLSSHPDNPLARFQLGMAQFTQGDAQAALTTWEPMLTIEEDFMAKFHSALALTELKRFAEAKKLLDATRLSMPHDHPLQTQLNQLLSNSRHTEPY